MEKSAIFNQSKTGRFMCNLSKEKFLVKDQNYFRDKTWNNSYLSGEKCFKLYHEKENKLKENCDKFEKDIHLAELQGKQTYHESFAMQSREKSLQSYLHLIKQRENLQKMSNQPIKDQSLQRTTFLLSDSQLNVNPLTKMTRETITSNQIGTRSQSKSEIQSIDPKNDRNLRLLDRNPGQIWNKLSTMKKKHLEMLFPPKIMEMEWSAYQNCVKNQMNEEKKNAAINCKRKIIHDRILKNKIPRQSFQKESTNLLSKRYDLLPKISTTNMKGLAVFDILQVNGGCENEFIKMFMKKNSRVRELKSELRTSKCQKMEVQLNETKQEQVLRSNVSEAENSKEDIQKFEKNLEREKRHFFESKYPKINLWKISLFLKNE